MMITTIIKNIITFIKVKCNNIICAGGGQLHRHECQVCE